MIVIRAPWLIINMKISLLLVLALVAGSSIAASIDEKQDISKLSGQELEETLIEDDNEDEEEDDFDEEDEEDEEEGQSSLVNSLLLQGRSGVCDGKAKGSCKKQGGECVTAPFADNCKAIYPTGKLKKKACKSKECQCCAPPPTCGGKIKKSCSKNGGYCVLKPFKSNCRGGTLDKKSCKGKHCQCCIPAITGGTGGNSGNKDTTLAPQQTTTLPPVTTTAPPAPTTLSPGAPTTTPPPPPTTTILPNNPTTITAKTTTQPPAPTTTPPAPTTTPPAPTTTPPAPTTTPPAPTTTPPAPITTHPDPTTTPPAPTTTPPAPTTTPPAPTTTPPAPTTTPPAPTTTPPAPTTTPPAPTTTPPAPTTTPPAPTTTPPAPTTQPPTTTEAVPEDHLLPTVVIRDESLSWTQGWFSKKTVTYTLVLSRGFGAEAEFIYIQKDKMNMANLIDVCDLQYGTYEMDNGRKGVFMVYHDTSLKPYQKRFKLNTDGITQDILNAVGTTIDNENFPGTSTSSSFWDFSWLTGDYLKDVKC